MTDTIQTRRREREVEAALRAFGPWHALVLRPPWIAGPRYRARLRLHLMRSSELPGHYALCNWRGLEVAAHANPPIARCCQHCLRRVLGPALAAIDG